MNNIYQQLIEIVDNIEQIFANDNNEEIKEISVDTIQIISSFKKQIIEELGFLKSNQEWDSYTIAFYGETNAGKSTIIESLRIYYGEKTKLEEQINFEQYNTELKNNIINLKDLEEQLTDKTESLEAMQTKYKKRYSWFFGLLYYWYSLLIGRDDYIKTYRTLNREIKYLKKGKEILINKIETLNNNLLKLQDGSIIGDGRSDFTKNTSEYHLTINNENVTLLDLPGIEGKEQIVINEILKGVSKAHVVFYVTKSNTPPQKGDGKTKGTIDKIQEHLSSHTEVYTIYNKPITNPRALQNNLLNTNEMESIEILNSYMMGILKGSYKDCKCISAQMAFYAVANNLMDNSIYLEQKNKFLANNSQSILLEKAGFLDFIYFINSDLVADGRKKIKKANYKKAINIIEQFIYNIEAIQEQNIKPLIADYEVLNNDSYQSIDNFVNNFKIDIENRINKEIELLIYKVRSRTYKKIDGNHSNGKIKEFFQKELSNKVNILSSNINSIIKKHLSKLEKDIKHEIKKIKDKQDVLLNTTYNINVARQFNFNVKMKSNINIKNKAFAIAVLAAPLIVNIWNPVGWFAIIGSIVGIVVVLIKTIIAFFDEEYKKAQQRKSIDEALTKFEIETSKYVQKNITKVIEVTNSAIDNVKAELNKSIDEIKILDNNLTDSKEYLLNIQENLINEVLYE